MKKPKVPLEEKTHDELRAMARSLYGLEADEVNASFPSIEELRKFLADAKKTRGMIEHPDESKLGWDKVDKTPLDDSANAVVQARKKQKEARLKKSIDDAGGKVSEKEVASTMKDISRLLGGSDDVDDD